MSAIRCLVITTFVFAMQLPGSARAQQNGDAPMINRSDHQLLQSFRWRSIGPIGQGGRVDDIAVARGDTRMFFVGFATGGLWKTTNNGVTFKPVFDTYKTGSIGAVAVAPSNSSVVWVGTGESNNRQSSSYGAGVYRSTDSGETFTLVGLEETQAIARIVVHPRDPDVAWVAATGRLFGPSPERGVFKTTDGGRNWNKVLYVDENTGATDLVMNSSNPNTLFASTYERRRTACCFVGGGAGSGIWRSDDGGDTWTRLEDNGLPGGTMGRIALAATPADPDVIYAQIEVAADRERPLSDVAREEWTRLARADSLPPDTESSGVWRSTDNGGTWQFRSNENGRPMYFSQIRVDPSDADIVYVVDQQVHKSTDGGLEFQRLSGYGHVDQHAFWIDPDDGNHIMIGNDGSVDVSYDQGENWESLRSWAVGQPYHASVDMSRPYNVCTGLQDNGTWCGPSSVRGGAILAQDWYRAGGGDGFYSAIDPTDSDVLYVESQGGNMRRVNLATGEQGSIRPNAPSERNPNSNIVPAPEEGMEIRWNWNTPLILSPHNPRVLYAGANRVFKSLDQGRTWTMSPDLTKNIDRDDVEIMGQSNELPRCRAIDRGEECILSKNDGVSRYSTMASLSESRLMPGLLWAGSDDGNIQVSRDGGTTWTEVGRNISGGTMEYYVSRVEASHHDAGTAYASLDGHRSDDTRPYVFVTRDYGQNWQSITSDLPAFGNVNTVRQDPRNPKLLYVGTEVGFFISMDEGGSWHRFMNDLPTTRIDDVLVHPRDNDLVLATHGRSVMIIDDITPLQGITDEVLASDVHLFEPRDAVLWKRDTRMSRSVTGNKTWRGEGASAGTALSYYLADSEQDGVELTVTDLRSGDVFRNLEGPGEAGLNRVQWDLRGNQRAAPEGGGRGGFGRGGGRGGRGGGRPTADVGVYRVTLSVDGREYSTTVNVLEDIWMGGR